MLLVYLKKKLKLVEICDVGNYCGIVVVKLFNFYIETIHIKIKTKKTYIEKGTIKTKKNVFYLTKLLRWECCKEEE